MTVTVTSGPRVIRKRVAVIYNPVAGFFQRGRLRRFLKHLRAAGHEIILRRTEGPGHATVLARSLDPSEVDVVVAAGGDGTINETANGLVGSSIPLAVAPLGTANVFACELGQGRAMKRAAEMVGAGKMTEIYPPKANGRHFLLMVSIGPDSRVVAGIDKGLKKIVGKLAYVIAALKEIAFGAPKTVSVTVDGVSYEAGLAIITQASRYGGPFVIAPNARLGDEDVSVLLLAGTRRRALLKYGLAMLTNRVATLKDATLLRGRRVRIDGPEGMVVQSDGDVFGAAPMEIVSGSLPLRLLVPDPARIRSVVDLRDRTEGPVAVDPQPAPATVRLR